MTAARRLELEVPVGDVAVQQPLPDVPRVDREQHVDRLEDGQHVDDEHADQQGSVEWVPPRLVHATIIDHARTPLKCSQRALHRPIDPW